MHKTVQTISHHFRSRRSSQATKYAMRYCGFASIEVDGHGVPQTAQRYREVD